MKCQVKTAHGYLSFQPPANPNDPVRIEYRPSPGVWEEIELIGWDLPVTAPPPTESTPPPATTSHWPGNIQPRESADYVGDIKNWLQSQGVNLAGPCGAFHIISNVAWGLETLNTGAGLLSKPDGNNCMSYSVDIIAYRDYQYGGTRIVDILGDAGGQNNPNWIEKPPEENVAMDRWRPPIDPSTVTRTVSGKSAKHR